MGQRRFCDSCGLMNASIETYGLRRQLRLAGQDHWTTEGAGSIELCLACWTRIGKPKMRPWKKAELKAKRAAAP